MKLAVLTSAFPPFAASESDYVSELCEALTERGVAVHAFVPRGGPASAFSFPVSRSRGWAGVLSNLLSQPVDTLLVPYQPWLFQDTPGALRAVRILKWARPHIVRTAVLFNPDPLTADQEPFLSQFDRVIVLSERHACVFGRKFPHLANRTSVIPPFSLVKSENLRSRNHTEGEIFQWLALGFVYPGKGIETLLKAFARSAPATSRSHLTIVGGTLEPGANQWNEFGRWLRLSAEALGIAPFVEWAGAYATPETFPSELLRRSHAAVVPYDVGLGINNSALATLAQASLPILSTRGSFLDSDLKHGDNCWLVRPRKPKELAQAMAQIQQDAELRGRLRTGSHHLSLRVYDRASLFDEWNTILRRDIATAARKNGRLIPRPA